MSIGNKLKKVAMTTYLHAINLGKWLKPTIIVHKNYANNFDFKKHYNYIEEITAKATKLETENKALRVEQATCMQMKKQLNTLQLVWEEMIPHLSVDKHVKDHYLEILRLSHES